MVILVKDLLGAREVLHLLLLLINRLNKTESRNGYLSKQTSWI